MAVISCRPVMVQTLSLASEAALWQVELGQGFSLFLSMPLCATVFELNCSSLTSFDHVLHKYQRLGLLALAGMSLFVRAIVRSDVRPYLGRLVLTRYCKRIGAVGFLRSQAGKHIQDGTWPRGFSTGSLTHHPYDPVR